MQTVVIIGVILTLILLIATNRVKLNIFSIFSILLIASSLYHMVFIRNEVRINFIKFTDHEKLTEVWQNYSNQNIINDLQVTRTLNPYKNQNASLIEPNTVVDDNEYIYSISNNSVMITSANGLKIKEKLTFIGQKFKPMNLFVTNKNLVVIGQFDDKTRGYIYDKDTLNEVKNIEMNAVYITSRIIDDELILITSKIIDTKEVTKIRPTYTINGIKHVVGYQDIYYVDSTYPNNYVNILKTDLNDHDKTKVMTYLGLGQTVYFTNKAIYVAEEKYKKENQSNKTIIIKFCKDNLTLSGLQEVLGYVLDQYSLDEYNGFLRVATTTRDDDESSNLYILDEKMNIIGRLENFSHGNEIQAATFIDDKAYIETFNILDPFYVIDLSNVKRPKILSELKFDGYNTNFIAYDKNHLIAFGLVLNDKKQSEGIKVSIYDVANPQNVVIEASDTIMYSEYNSAYTDVLYNNQTLLLDRKNEILGFPITYWIKDEQSVTSYYKQFYLVYDIKNQQLKRLGKISHYQKGQVDDISDDIKRAIVINGYLYTVSDLLIKENRLNDLFLIKEIELN